MKTRSQTLGDVSDTDMSQGIEPLVTSIGHGPPQENSPNDSVDSKTSESASYNEKGANGDSLQEVISDQESDDTSQGSDDKSQDSEDSETKGELSDSNSENKDDEIYAYNSSNSEELHASDDDWEDAKKK